MELHSTITKQDLVDEPDRFEFLTVAGNDGRIIRLDEIHYGENGCSDDFLFLVWVADDDEDDIVATAYSVLKSMPGCGAEIMTTGNGFFTVRMWPCGDSTPGGCKILK